MKPLLFKSLCTATLLAVVFYASACDSSKTDKVKHYNAIMDVVNKTDSINAKVEALMVGYANAKSAEAFSAAVTTITAQEAEIGALKATLAAMPSPTFEDNNTKKSTEEWLDMQLKTFPIEKNIFGSVVTMFNLQTDIERVTAEGEEVSEETKTALMNAEQTRASNTAISDANDIAIKSARAAVLANLQKFATENKLK